MRVVVQRVSHASVTINGTCKSAIKKGFLVLLGIEEADNQEDADWLCKKIIGLRVFDDENGVMNKSILEAGGDILVVSQFTLMASTKKGNRPSYIRAARHETAIPLYEYFCNELSIGLGKQVRTGEFGADMKVALVHSSTNLPEERLPAAPEPRRTRSIRSRPSIWNPTKNPCPWAPA